MHFQLLAVAFTAFLSVAGGVSPLGPSSYGLAGDQPEKHGFPRDAPRIFQSGSDSDSATDESLVKEEDISAGSSGGSGGGSLESITEDRSVNTGTGDPTSSTDPVYPATPIVGPVYYVAPYGDDSRTKAQAANAGTPWRTLQKAVDNVIAGDTVVVKDGVYTTSQSSYLVQINGKSGTKANPIRFVAENRWGAVLDGKFTPQELIQIRHSHHLIIEGFEIRNGKLRGVRSSFSNSHITLRNNWIHHNAHLPPVDCTNTDGQGVLTSYESRHWLFDSNLINNNGSDVKNCTLPYADKFQHGLYLNGAHHVIINNILFDHLAGYNIKIGGAKNDDGSKYAYPSDKRGFVILNNTIVAEHHAQQGNASSITLFANNGVNVRNGLITNNVFWGSDRRGHYSIHVSGGGWPWSGTEIVNNVTDADHIFRPDRVGEVHLLADNVDNTTNPGIRGTTLGMRSPRTRDAGENDFRLTSNALLLIDKGRSTFLDQGRADLPVADYANLPRPVGNGIDIGAFEWRTTYD
jgi:hypothetical protein